MSVQDGAMDSDERALFAESVGAATSSSATGAELDAALDAIGWRDALAMDPRNAVEVLFDSQGRAGATSSALSWLVVDTLAARSGPSPSPPGAISGAQNERPAAAVLPEVASIDPPGRLDGGVCAVRGLGLATTADAEDCLVVYPDGDGFLAHLVPAAELHTAPVSGLDPALGLVRVSADDIAVDRAEPVDWPAAVASAQLAVAHELIGASRSMLDLARTHALERIQFGKPIARFQAVRHRLAETLVAIEAAEAAADGAWREGTVFGAGVAKAVAGRSARVAVRHCQQVLAGIGFTSEHALHTYVRRVLVLDGLFGDARTLTRDLGRDLLDSRQLPPMLPL